MRRVTLFTDVVTDFVGDRQDCLRSLTLPAPCPVLLSDGGFLDFAVTDARGADANTLAGTLYEGMHGLEVKIPAALRNIVGVADAVPELRSTTAHFTNFCHKNTPPPKSEFGRNFYYSRMAFSVQPIRCR